MFWLVDIFVVFNSPVTVNPEMFAAIKVCGFNFETIFAPEKFAVFICNNQYNADKRNVT